MSECDWKMEIPVISTSHLEEATARRLTVMGLKAPAGAVAVYPEGFFLQTSILTSDMPEDLAAVLKWAEQRDFRWIRFDADGVVVDLPAYEWEQEEIAQAAHNDLYLVWVEGDVDPSVRGPFHNDRARLAAARELRAGEGRKDSLFRLNVTSGAQVVIDPFSGDELGE